MANFMNDMFFIIIANHFLFAQLRVVNCLSQNFRLAELYLQHNELKDISGCLQHLTCLKVLLLHNNQLEKLEKVIFEFRKMQNLEVLSKSATM